MIDPLMQTHCGVDMSELERALVAKGWTVSSWKAVDQIMQSERVTGLQAAKRLGTGLLLQVNSLEQSTQNPLKDLHWETKFYESDRRGRMGPLAAVPEKRAQTLESMMRAAQAKMLPSSRIGSSINVTAVLVETGQTVWFYNWNHWRRSDDDFVNRQLFVCNWRHLDHCIPQEPRRSTWSRSSQPTRSGSDLRDVAGEEYANVTDNAYLRATRETMENLVGKLEEWARH